MPMTEGLIKPFAVIGLWWNWAGGCQASHQSLWNQGCPQVVWLEHQSHFCWLQRWKHLIFLFLLQERNCFLPSPKYEFCFLLAFLKPCSEQDWPSACPRACLNLRRSITKGLWAPCSSDSWLSTRFHDKEGFFWPQITWEPAEFANPTFSPCYMMRLLGKQAGFWSVFPTRGFLLGAIKGQVKCGGGWVMHSVMFCLLLHCDNLCFAGMFFEAEGCKHVL